MTAAGQGTTAVRRAALPVVGGAVAVFALTAGLVTELATRSRYAAGQTSAREGTPALRDFFAHAATPYQGPPPTVDNPVADPAASWPALLGHVAALSLVLAAALLVVTALVARGRASGLGWSAVVGAGLAASAAGAAGPLGVLPPLLPAAIPDQWRTGMGGTAAQQQRWRAYLDTQVDFVSPLWLRAAAAGFVLLLVAGTAVLVRRRLAAAQVPDAPTGLVGAPVAYGLLAAVVLLVLVPPLRDPAGAGLLSVPTVVAGLLLAPACAAAGQALASRAATLALTTAVAVAGAALWLAAGREPGTPAFGFGELGSDGPTVGNPALLLVLVAAVPAGHLAAVALRSVSRRPAAGRAARPRRTRPAAS